MMGLDALREWMQKFSPSGDIVWYLKRLSSNDTLAVSHQAGPYIPRNFLFQIFPSISRTDKKNPEVLFDLFVDSHGEHRNARVVWYNNKFHGGTRNEARITRLGGKKSALLSPDNIGALSIFAFVRGQTGEAVECHAWLCVTAEEEDEVQNRYVSVEPGQCLVWPPLQGIWEIVSTFRGRADCYLTSEEIPPEWKASFPPGNELAKKSIEMRPNTDIDPDERLLKRRLCEFQIFESLEEFHEKPAIEAGFGEVALFLERSQRILQRRKSRAGRSLELHVRQIFSEEGLVEHEDFEYGVESEPRRKPDFLFPSRQCYRDPDFPEDCLRILAVKTTCRDRWRQVLNEAERIRIKHLLTLQEGVSEHQFREMKESGIKLVVPERIIGKYPKGVQPELMTLRQFISEVRGLRRAARPGQGG